VSNSTANLFPSQSICVFGLYFCGAVEEGGVVEGLSFDGRRIAEHFLEPEEVKFIVFLADDFVGPGRPANLGGGLGMGRRGEGLGEVEAADEKIVSKLRIRLLLDHL
jgi:hypothetical protein